MTTLAEHCIRGAMLDYLRQIDQLPRGLRQFQNRRDAVIADYNRASIAASRADPREHYRAHQT